MKILLGMMFLLVLIGMPGCGDKTQAQADKALETARHSFDQSPDDLKAKYQALTLAMQNNDLVKAKAALDQLTQAELSADQQLALAEKKRELMVKLSAAVQSGDTNVGKIIEELRLRRGTR